MKNKTMVLLLASGMICVTSAAEWEEPAVNSVNRLPARQVQMFEREVRKGLPIILCMHVPIYSDEIAIASYKFWMSGDWKTPSLKFTSAAVPPPNKTRRAQVEDLVTREFIALLRSERLLKAILVGHEHFSMRDDFSPTAEQYIVGGNFMFHGREFLFS